MRIKKGDNVKILSGKDRGKTGKILAVYPKENKLTVEGMNVITRHRRSRRQGQKGEKVRISMPIDVSNAMLVCGSCGNATRAGFKVTAGVKVRVCKKCGSEV